jgi:hypothetical protein
MDEGVKQAYTAIIEDRPIEAVLIRVALAPKSSEGVLGLYELESSIGGVGIHNVEKRIVRENDGTPALTGAYHRNDRQLFRGIQYCAAHFILDWQDADSRQILTYSGSHVSDCLGLRIAVSTGKRTPERPLGQLIELAKERDILGPTRIAVLRAINKVYRVAKHKFPEPSSLDDGTDELSLEARTFSFSDALVHYACCRIVGHEILTDCFAECGQPLTYGELPACTQIEYFQKVERIMKTWGRRPREDVERFDSYLEGRGSEVLSGDPQ